MPRTARKRQTTEKATSPVSSGEDKPKAIEEVAPPTVIESVPTEISDDDPTAALTSAYWFAIDERDVVTGTIPAAPLDAVKVTYRAVPKRQRGDAATSLGAEAAQRMVSPDGTVDSGLAVAMGTLSALFAQVNAERSVRIVATPHDPVPGVAGMLGAFDLARQGILDNLTDEQRERVEQVDVASDADAQAVAGTTIAALAKISERVLNGRKRPARVSTGGTGSGVPGRDLGQLLRDAVASADRPITLGTIARDHDVSTGALDNRWTKENTDGVASVRDASGRKAFQAA